MIVTKTLQFTAKNYFRFWFKKTFPNIFRTFFAIFCLLGIFSYYPLFNLLKNFKEISTIIFVTVWIIFILLLTALIIILPILIKWHSFNSKENQKFYEPFHYEFDQKLIKSIRENGGEIILNWENIEKVSVSEEYFCLVINKFNTFLVPFSSFQTKKDFQQFKNMLKQKGFNVEQS